MTETEITKLNALAQRTGGWDFRECPPQLAIVASGCNLIVVPPVSMRTVR